MRGRIKRYSVETGCGVIKPDRVGRKREPNVLFSDLLLDEDTVAKGDRVYFEIDTTAKDERLPNARRVILLDKDGNHLN